MPAERDPAIVLVKRTRREVDCLVWTGPPGTHGYPMISLSRRYRHELGDCPRVITAAALVCRLTFGPPPPHHEALHSCDNKLCVEPTHLRWGTRSENVIDAYDRNLQPCGEQHGAIKFPAALVTQLRQRHAAGEHYTLVAAELGISGAHAHKIVHGLIRVREFNQGEP